MMNIMQEIMELLGVKENEEFELIRANTGQKLDHHYAFNKYGFCCIKTDDHGRAIGIKAYATDMVGRIVDGDLEIVKIPWRPKEGERYYYIGVDMHDEGTVWDCVWEENDITDIMRYKLGNCFKTEKEAISNIDACLKWLKSEPITDWRDSDEEDS